MQPLDISGKRIRHDDHSRTRSSTDDVHSLCSQLSNLNPRSLKYADSASSSSSVLLLHKNYNEPSPPPANLVQYKSIHLATTQKITEFVQHGELPTFKKQGSRSTNNPWRRYGALRKLCDTGGFAPNSGSRKERKNRESLVAVKTNVKIPVAPTSCQMTLNKVRDPGQYEIKLALKAPKDTPVDVAAQSLAEQVKIFILHHGHELVEDGSVLTAQSK